MKEEKMHRNATNHPLLWHFRESMQSHSFTPNLPHFIFFFLITDSSTFFFFNFMLNWQKKIITFKFLSLLVSPHYLKLPKKEDPNFNGGRYKP